MGTAVPAGGVPALPGPQCGHAPEAQQAVGSGLRLVRNTRDTAAEAAEGGGGGGGDGLGDAYASKLQARHADVLQLLRQFSQACAGHRAELSEAQQCPEGMPIKGDCYTVCQATAPGNS